ncbi:hypothetical protein WA026_013186 [Henosepilachna vigintioctopunctata]|uniref:Uncharacterized protein n=1 Tax=Henosepilachna vigintioctopunctata TaxID=420089 RepID=A0AAW1UM57_9CUCU
MDEVEVEQLERWIIRKSQRLKKKSECAARNGRKTSLSRWKFCVHADKRKMLQDLTQSLQLRPTKDHVLWELANCIRSAVNADGFKLFLVDRGNAESLSLYLECKTEGAEPKLRQIQRGISIPAYVAKTGETVRVSRGSSDPRFPDGIPDETSTKKSMKCIHEAVIAGMDKSLGKEMYPEEEIQLLKMQVKFLTKLLMESQSKNNIIMQNNGLLLQKCRSLEKSMKVQKNQCKLTWKR